MRNIILFLVLWNSASAANTPIPQPSSPPASLPPKPMTFLRFHAEHPEEPALVECEVNIPEDPVYPSRGLPSIYVCIYIKQVDGDLDEFAYVRKNGRNKDKILSALEDGKVHRLRLIMRGQESAKLITEILDIAPDKPADSVIPHDPPLNSPAKPLTDPPNNSPPIKKPDPF